MRKVVILIGGILLAAWGVIRPVVDLLESLKATSHYADFIYCHASFLLVPRSTLFTIGLLIAGTSLIFSERLTEIVDNWWPRTPNIQLQRAMNAGVTWDASNGCYIRQPSTDFPRIAIILETANEVKYGKPSPTAGRVKAQITYHYANKDKSELHVVPGAWIDEPLSSVELDCGDTRWLIACVSFHFTQDWKVPVNRRSDFKNPQSFDHHDIFGWSDTRGTMDVNIISMDTNRILKTFTFDWQWNTGYPITLTRYVGPKDS